MRTWIFTTTCALMVIALSPGATDLRAYSAMADRQIGLFNSTAKAVTVLSRGVAVPAVLVVPKATGKYPLVVMAHGHGGSKDENGGFTAIADVLASRGIASIRMDFPGCGASVESFTQNNVTNMMADVAAARAYAIANASIDTRAVAMFGYRMGGRIAILSEGHVLITTPYGQVQDLSAKFFTDNEATRSLSAVAAFPGRILIVTGDADTIIPFEIIQRVKNAAKKSAGIEIVRVAGADHGYGFYGGESTIKTQTVEAVASFFARTLR